MVIYDIQPPQQKRVWKTQNLTACRPPRQETFTKKPLAFVVVLSIVFQLIGSAVLLFTPQKTQAVETYKYWVGSASGNIHSASNWSSTEGSACGENGGAGVPGFDDVMVFTADCTNSTATAAQGINVKGLEIRDGYTGTIGVTTHSIGPLGFSQAGGTFNAGTRFSVITGDFTLTGGTFNASSLRMTVNGAFDIQGGTFNHNNGSVDIVRGANSTLTALPPVFNDLHITDGLLGRWKLDEGTGNTAFDSSGMAVPKDGTLVDGAQEWVNDAPDLDFLNSSSLQFNGTQGLSVQASSNAGRYHLSNGELTVSAWVKRTDLSSGMIVADDGSGNANLWLLRVNGNGYQFRIRGCGTAPPTSCGQSGTNSTNVQIQSEDHPINEWNHVVGVKTRDLMTLYVNGVAEATAVPPQYFHHHNRGTCIGARSVIIDCDSNLFTGLIADARIYNRALSAGEVANLANGSEYAGGSSPSITQTLSSELEVAGNLSISHAILDLAGNNLTLDVASSTFANSGVLKLQGGETLTNFTNATTSGAVEYTGSGTYNSLIAGDGYYNLTFSGSGSWTLDNDLVVNKKLTLSSGTLAQSTSALSVAGNFAIANGATFTKSSNGSNLNLVGDLTFTDSNTTKQNLGVVVVGSSPDTIDLASNMTADSLTVSAGDRLNTNGYDLTIAHDITIAGTLDATDDVAGDGSIIALGRDWSNTGTFTATGSSVSLTGIDQSISGSNTFGNLTKTVSSAATLTFEAGATQTITGTLTLQGVSGRLLSLRSSVPETQWKIDPQGTRTLSYLDVMDSDNINTTAIYAYDLNITDSGNNTSWTFDAPPGSALPPAAFNLPTPPLEGFQVLINQGAKVTSNRVVALDLRAGDNIDRMAVSMSPDFTDVGQEAYSATKQWDLCAQYNQTLIPPTCADGTYIVYVQFYTSYGQPSEIVSQSIVLEAGGQVLGDEKTEFDSPQASKPLEPSAQAQQPVHQPFEPLKFFRYGTVDADIRRLQKFLNEDPDTRLAESGWGAPGNETNFFGPRTWQAVVRFQKKYTKDVLAPWGITKGTGFVGKTTLAKINELIKKTLGQ